MPSESGEYFARRIEAQYDQIQKDLGEIKTRLAANDESKKAIGESLRELKTIVFHEESGVRANAAKLRNIMWFIGILTTGLLATIGGIVIRVAVAGI